MARAEMLYRESLSDHDKVNMLATLTRHENAIKQAIDRAPDNLFDANCGHFELYWAVLRDYYEVHREMPRKSTLATAINAAVAAVGSEFDDDQFAQLSDIVSTAFQSKKSELATTVAMTQFRQCLEEGMIRELRSTLAFDGAPRDISGVLASARDRAAAISAIDSGDVDSPFPANWKPKALKKTSTGIPFIDLFLGGGDVEGEVYGLLGPVGSCKTTLMVMLSTAGAFRDWAEWDASEHTSPLRFSYHFNYEGPVDAIKQRALCHTGLIDKDILALEDFEDQLNRKGGILRPYEHQLLKGLIKTEALPTEWRRYKTARRRLNNNWRVIDMSGNDKRFPGRGAGGLSEIVDIVGRDLEKIRRDGLPGYDGPTIDARCGVVAVDYASLACSQAVQSRNVVDFDAAMRRALSQFNSTAKNDLATAFDARVWIAQQLNGDANSLAPGRLPKRTDSKDNRMFAENLDFCFMIGNPDLSNLVAFGTDKQRREGRRPPEVLHIIGNLQTVQLARGHQIDPMTNRFVRSEDRERIADAPLSQHRTSRRRGFDRQLLGGD